MGEAELKEYVDGCPKMTEVLAIPLPSVRGRVLQLCAEHVARGLSYTAYLAAAHEETGFEGDAWKRRCLAVDYGLDFVCGINPLEPVAEALARLRPNATTTDLERALVAVCALEAETDAGRVDLDGLDLTANAVIQMEALTEYTQANDFDGFMPLGWYELDYPPLPVVPCVDVTELSLEDRRIARLGKDEAKELDDEIPF